MLDYLTTYWMPIASTIVWIMLIILAIKESKRGQNDHEPYPNTLSDNIFCALIGYPLFAIIFAFVGAISTLLANFLAAPFVFLMKLILGG